jgi:hypothetical protein
LVDSSQRRNINGLSTDGTTGTDSGGVFTGTTLDDGFEEDGERIGTGEEVDDLEGLFEMTDGHLLLTVLGTATNHELVDEALEDRAGDLLETLLLVLTSGVRNVDLGLLSLNREVIEKRLLGALDFFIRPFSKELGLNSEVRFNFNSRCVVGHVEIG